MSKSMAHVISFQSLYILSLVIQRSEQSSWILFDKMDHISFGSMSRFELIFNNVNAARRSSPIRLRKWVLQGRTPGGSRGFGRTSLLATN